MKKTAIQQAIEKITQRGGSIPPRSSIGTGLSMAINILKEFIEEERDQIEDAFGAGIMEEFLNKGDKVDPQSYYNETYGS